MIGSTQEVDGTGGNQPRYSTITGNLLHEIGMHVQKSGNVKPECEWLS